MRKGVAGGILERGEGILKQRDGAWNGLRGKENDQDSLLSDHITGGRSR